MNIHGQACLYSLGKEVVPIHIPNTGKFLLYLYQYLVLTDFNIFYLIIVKYLFVVLICISVMQSSF